MVSTYMYLFSAEIQYPVFSKYSVIKYLVLSGFESFKKPLSRNLSS